MEEVTAFMYAHFARGTRAGDDRRHRAIEEGQISVQLRLIEYIYQRILRTDSDWVARSLFRGEWQRAKDAVERCAYNKDDVCTLVLQTSNEIMLTELMSREIVEGDLGTNATTICFWAAGPRARTWAGRRSCSRIGANAPPRMSCRLRSAARGWWRCRERCWEREDKRRLTTETQGAQ